RGRRRATILRRSVSIMVTTLHSEKELKFILTSKGVKMRTFHFLLIVLISLSLLLSACGGQQENHEDMATPAETSEAVYESEAWMGMTLTDARTGAAFKLSDYNGKTVILEMMDPGCPVCSVQVKEVVAALDTLGDNAVAVS